MPKADDMYGAIRPRRAGEQFRTFGRYPQAPHHGVHRRRARGNRRWPGTIAAESQQLINETYPAFVQQFMPHYGQPDADELGNISAAIVVDQQRLGGNSRSTVATVTDAAQMLRVIFSRAAEPALPSPGFYSYNDPRGMCPDCEGIGQVAAMDMSAVIDESKSLNEGALLPKDFAVESWYWEIYRNSGLFDMDKPIKKFGKEERENLLHLDDGRKIKVGKIGLTYEGVVAKLKKGLGSKDPEQLQPHVRAEYDNIFTRETCPRCRGARLTKRRSARPSKRRTSPSCLPCRSRPCALHPRREGEVGAADARCRGAV